MAAVVIALVFLWIAWSYLADFRAARQERKWREEKALLRRTLLARAPDSPNALESLGDALREKGDYAEAIACYEEATEMAAKRPLATGLGEVPGGGLETKLRLTRLERDQEQDPAAFGATLRTRQQVCHQCGALGLPYDVACTTCGNPLPVNSLFDTWRNASMRRSLTMEALQAGLSLTIITVCLLVVNGLEPLLRFTIFFSAVIAVGGRFLKRIGPD